ncbi:MAG: hypothetical protein QW512_00325 [Thermofilaceae archaeon]
METTRLLIPPFSLSIDGALVDVLEVSKQPLPSGEVWYVVSCSIRYKGVKSKVFPLFVRDEDDLKNKLKIEMTKVKFLELAYGLEELKRIII